MGWPFNNASKNLKTKEPVTTSKQGLFDKLLGKKQDKQDIQSASVSSSQGQSSSPWHLPEDSFDEVSKLLEETKQKAPNQPLLSNPYRTSLSLEDEVEDIPEIKSEVKSETVTDILPEPQQEVSVVEKVKNWKFNANDLVLGNAHFKATEDDILMEVPMPSPPINVVFDGESTAEVVSEILAIENENSTIDISDLASDFPITQQACDDDFGFEIDSAHNQPEPLPLDASLQSLIQENVLNFISTAKPIEVNTVFKINDVRVAENKSPDLNIEVLSAESSHQAPVLNVDEWSTSVSSSDEQFQDWFSSNTQEDSPGWQLPEQLQSENQSNLLEQPLELNDEIFADVGIKEEDLYQESSKAQGVEISDSWPALNAQMQQAESSAEFEAWFNHDLSKETVPQEDAAKLEFNPELAIDSNPSLPTKSSCDEQLQDVETLEPVITSNEFFSEKHQFSLDNLDDLDAIEPSYGSVNLDHDLIDEYPLPMVNETIENNSLPFDLGELESTSMQASSDILDLDEDVTSYQNYIETGSFEDEDSNLTDAPVFELKEPLDIKIDAEFPSNSTLKLEETDALEDIVDFTQHPRENALSDAVLFPAECLEPPPMAGLPSTEIQDAESVEAPKNICQQTCHALPMETMVEKPQTNSFYEDILLQEMKVTKQRIDYLVERYFIDG